MVNVIAQDGTVLAPTNRNGKVRHLLKEKKAKVVSHSPFTIKLSYVPEGINQDNNNTAQALG